MLVGSGASVAAAVPARNIAATATRFLIDPQDHIVAIRGARDRGLAVLGFYHSHPYSPAVPSETDRAEAAYPENLYMIVSLIEDRPEHRLYRLTDGNFRELAFVTSD